jgi:hypothetical protein
MTIDPARKYVLHKIEKHLTQLQEFGVLTDKEVAKFIKRACEKELISVETFMEEHW